MLVPNVERTPGMQQIGLAQKSMRWFLPAWGRHACLAMRNRRHLTDKWLCTWQSTSAVGARPRLEGFINSP